MRQTFGASQSIEVERHIKRAAEKEGPPLSSRVRVADTSIHTSEGSQSVEVEGHIKKAAEREVPSLQNWAQLAGSVG